MTKMVVLDGRALCDLELLLNGGFDPLNGYLTQDDYNSVVTNCRLSTGEVWPMPIVFRVSADSVDDYRPTDYTDDHHIVLTDSTNLPLAKFYPTDFYQPDLRRECQLVYGSDDTNHPYVKEVLSEPDVYYLGGRVEKIQLPNHFDFQSLRLTPAQTRKRIADRGWKRVVGFQTRNPMHRSHQELTIQALATVKQEAQQVGITSEECGILLHPVVGVTQACDVDYHTRVRCYRKLISHYPNNSVELSLLPLSMRMAGPREALWHALIRKNYGCTHFVVGRDHAGPSYKTAEGKSFYGPYDAHALVEQYGDEIGIKVVLSQWMVYVEDTGDYQTVDKVPEGHTVKNISGTQQRELLRTGQHIPEWFTYPDIVEELRADFRPTHERGFCLYLVGLSGCGKTTLVGALHERLSEIVRDRKISVLDGDIARHHLSKGLGFSREDRSINVRRIGYVSSEIVKHGGICLVANIAPYESDRTVNREIINAESSSGYVEVYVNTSLADCERRDCKGLYRMAREGKIKEFTGISDPFEEPTNAEVTVNMSSPEEVAMAVDQVVNYLVRSGFIVKLDN
jgi:sulfate adenylyltransferase